MTPLATVLEIGPPVDGGVGRLLVDAGLEVVTLFDPKAEDHRPLATRRYNDTGKRSITLDLARPEGRDVFRRLASSIDIVVEGARPGELAADRIGYDDLVELNPDVIWASVTPFGQTGPYSLYSANDLVVFAMGGIMFISGQPGKPPVTAPDRQAYYVGALHTAVGLIGALWCREATGRGEWIDVSMFECLVAQENTISNFRGHGDFARRQGTQHRSALPGAVYPSADGHFGLYCGKGEHVWQAFLDWLDNPPGLTKEMGDMTVRWQHFTEIDSLCRAFVVARTNNELFDRALRCRVSGAPVQTPAEFLASSQTRHRDVVTSFCDGDAAYRSLRPAMGDRFHGQLEPARARGADTAEVLSRLAGVGADELAQLTEAAVV